VGDEGKKTLFIRAMVFSDHHVPCMTYDVMNEQGLDETNVDDIMEILRKNPQITTIIIDDIVMICFHKMREVIVPWFLQKHNKEQLTEKGAKALYNAIRTQVKPSPNCNVIELTAGASLLLKSLADLQSSQQQKQQKQGTAMVLDKAPSSDSAQQKQQKQRTAMVSSSMDAAQQKQGRAMVSSMDAAQQKQQKQGRAMVRDEAPSIDAAQLEIRRRILDKLFITNFPKADRGLFKIREIKSTGKYLKYGYFKKKKDAEQCREKIVSLLLQITPNDSFFGPSTDYKPRKMGDYGYVDSMFEYDRHSKIVRLLKESCTGFITIDKWRKLKADVKQPYQEQQQQKEQKQEQYQEQKQQQKKQSHYYQEQKQEQKKQSQYYQEQQQQQKQQQKDLVGDRIHTLLEAAAQQTKQSKYHPDGLHLLRIASTMKPVTVPQSTKYSKRSPDILHLQKQYHHILSQTIMDLQTKAKVNLFLVDDFWRDRIALPEDILYVSDYVDIRDSVVIPGKEIMGLFAVDMLPEKTIMGPYPAFLYADRPRHPTQRAFNLVLHDKPYLWDIGADLKHAMSTHYLDFVNSITLDVGHPVHKQFEKFLKKVLEKLGKNVEDFIVPSSKLNLDSINIDQRTLRQMSTMNGGWFYKTRRPIEVGEELIINYGYDYLNNLVDKVLFPQWKEKLSGSEEEKIAFHRLSICWLFSQENIDQRRIQQNIAALSRLCIHHPHLNEQINRFKQDPMTLKNPCDEIENWIKNPKRKHKQLSHTTQQQDEKHRLKQFEVYIKHWIGKNVDDLQLDENDLDKIGMSISPEGILELNKRMKKSKYRVVD
jgi:flagellar motor protein MotB